MPGGRGAACAERGAGRDTGADRIVGRAGVRADARGGPQVKPEQAQALRRRVRRRPSRAVLISSRPPTIRMCAFTLRLLDSIFRMGEHRATAAFANREETKLKMKRMNLAKHFAVATFAVLFTLVTTFPATAQNAPSQKQLNIAAMRAERKAVVGANMPLTKDEAKVFWPLYDEYEARMDKIEERHIKEVREYVASYETLTDADATKKLDQVVSIQEARLDVQRPIFRNS